MAVVKTAVSLPEDVVRRVDALASERGCSRSGLFRLALERFIDAEREAALQRQFNEAFAVPMDDEERAEFAGMQAIAAARLDQGNW